MEKIPETMRAWMLVEEERLELQRIPTPRPKADEVLIRVDAGCICNGSDPGIYRGHEAYTTPMVFGHEASGRIVDAGVDVADFRVGDRVCWWCETGAFAEYQAVGPNRVSMFPVPENVTVDESPVLELVIASCRSLMRTPPEQYGGTLLICGMGPSGLVLCQYARALGYERIIGWDLYETRRRLALELGVDEVWDPAKLDKASAEAMNKADVCVLMMGDDRLPGEPTATLAMRVTRECGCVVSYGHPEHGMRFSPYVFQSRDLTMVSPTSDHRIIREKGKEVMRMVGDGRIRIDPIITRRIDFKDFLAAFDHLLVRPEDQIKVIMKWESEGEV